MRQGDRTLVIVLGICGLVVVVPLVTCAVCMRDFSHEVEQASHTHVDERATAIGTYDRVFTEEVEAFARGIRADMKSTELASLRQQACIRRVAAMKARAAAEDIPGLDRRAEDLASACDWVRITETIDRGEQACVGAMTVFDNCEVGRLRQTVVTDGVVERCEAQLEQVGGACGL